jgi:hypothetical protein
MKRGLCLVSIAWAWAISPGAMADDAATATTQSCAGAYVQGQILRNDHKLVEARQVFRDCAQSVCKDFIVRDCSAWLDLVQASLPAVVPIAVDDRGDTLSEVKVQMDGAALLPALDGRAVEVDPGPHTFEFETSRAQKAVKTIIVPEGDKRVRVEVVFPRSPPAPPNGAEIPAPDRSAAAPPAPQVVAAVVPETPRNPKAALRAAVPWRTISLASDGVGVLGVGAGLGFGLEAMISKNASGCGAHDVCPTSAQARELDAARRAGDVATAFVAAGGALVASGVVIWILAPSPSPRVTTRVEPRGSGFVVSGSW